MAKNNVFINFFLWISTFQNVLSTNYPTFRMKYMTDSICESEME